MGRTIENAGEANFAEKVLQAQGLVLVDFWAEWCGPCKALAPVLDDISGEYPEVQIIKVNADENQALTQQTHVRGLPSLVLYSNGVECDRLTGVQTKTRISALLEKHLES